MLMPPAGIGEFRTRETLFNAPAAGAVAVASNGSRVEIIFGPAGANYSVSTLPGTATPRGILVQNSGFVSKITWQDDGALVNQTWFFTAAIVGSLSIIEVFYEPHGRRQEE